MFFKNRIGILALVIAEFARDLEPTIAWPELCQFFLINPNLSYRNMYS